MAGCREQMELRRQEGKKKLDPIGLTPRRSKKPHGRKSDSQAKKTKGKKNKKKIDNRKNNS
jgi:hypothetical protein